MSSISHHGVSFSLLYNPFKKIALQVVLVYNDWDKLAWCFIREWSHFEPTRSIKNSNLGWLYVLFENHNLFDWKSSFKIESCHNSFRWFDWYTHSQFVLCFLTVIILWREGFLWWRGNQVLFHFSSWNRLCLFPEVYPLQ